MLRSGLVTETRSRVSFASTVLPNPVGFLRLYHAQKPNCYRARGTPDVSLPAIAARPLVNTASGIVQFRVQSEVSRYSDQVRFDAISGAQLKGGSLRDRLKLSGPRSPPPSAPPCNLKRQFGFGFNNYLRSALPLRGVSSLPVSLGNEPRATTLLHLNHACPL